MFRLIIIVVLSSYNIMRISRKKQAKITTSSRVKLCMQSGGCADRAPNNKK